MFGFPQNLYVEILTLEVRELGNGLLADDYVIRMESSQMGLVPL